MVLKSPPARKEAPHLANRCPDGESSERIAAAM